MYASPDREISDEEKEAAGEMAITAMKLIKLFEINPPFRGKQRFQYPVGFNSSKLTTADLILWGLHQIGRTIVEADIDIYSAVNIACISCNILKTFERDEEELKELKQFFLLSKDYPMLTPAHDADDFTLYEHNARLERLEIGSERLLKKGAIQPNKVKGIPQETAGAVALECVDKIREFAMYRHCLTYLSEDAQMHELLDRILKNNNSDDEMNRMNCLIEAIIYYYESTSDKFFTDKIKSKFPPSNRDSTIAKLKRELKKRLLNLPV